VVVVLIVVLPAARNSPSEPATRFFELAPDDPPVHYHLVLWLPQDEYYCASLLLVFIRLRRLCRDP
jgi:hypothetical protein